MGMQVLIEWGKAFAPSLKNEKVGIIIFVSDAFIKKGDFIKRNWIYCGCFLRKGL
jgi:hypothetical protein